MSGIPMTEEQIKKVLEDIKQREARLLEDAANLAKMRAQLAEDEKVVRAIVEQNVTKNAVGKIFKTKSSTVDGKTQGDKWFFAVSAEGSILRGHSVEIKKNDSLYGVHLPNRSDVTIPEAEKEDSVPAEVKALLDGMKK
jgi:hypothetical protein